MFEKAAGKTKTVWISGGNPEYEQGLSSWQTSRKNGRKNSVSILLQMRKVEGVWFPGKSRTCACTRPKPWPWWLLGSTWPSAGWLLSEFLGILVLNQITNSFKTFPLRSTHKVKKGHDSWIMWDKDLIYSMLRSIFISFPGVALKSNLSFKRLHGCLEDMYGIK